jgi:hypothetical protein
MADLVRRVALGFVAAVISVLIFHQGMWTLLHFADLPGLGMPAPSPTDGVPPWGVPRIINLCFWGGLWGALFGAVWRGRRYWCGGLLLGVAAAATGLIVVAAIKGLPIGGGWKWSNWVRSLLINGTWGLGVGLILPPLTRLVTGRRDG